MLVLLFRLSACPKCKTAVIYNNAAAKRARLEVEPLRPWTGSGDGPNLQTRNAVSNVNSCMKRAIWMDLAKETGSEFMVMAAGVCQSGQAATKVNGEGVNFDSKDAFVSHLDVPGHPDLRIVVQIDGTGGPLTSIMKDKTTGLPLLHKSLESMALTGASAIHSHVKTCQAASNSNPQQQQQQQQQGAPGVPSAAAAGAGGGTCSFNVAAGSAPAARAQQQQQQQQQQAAPGVPSAAAAGAGGGALSFGNAAGSAPAAMAQQQQQGAPGVPSAAAAGAGGGAFSFGNAAGSAPAALGSSSSSNRAHQAFNVAAGSAPAAMAQQQQQQQQGAPGVPSAAAAGAGGGAFSFGNAAGSAPAAMAQQQQQQQGTPGVPSAAAAGAGGGAFSFGNAAGSAPAAMGSSSSSSRAHQACRALLLQGLVVAPSALALLQAAHLRQWRSSSSRGAPGVPSAAAAGAGGGAFSFGVAAGGAPAAMAQQQQQGAPGVPSTAAAGAGGGACRFGNAAGSAPAAMAQQQQQQQQGAPGVPSVAAAGAGGGAFSFGNAAGSAPAAMAQQQQQQQQHRGADIVRSAADLAIPAQRLTDQLKAQGFDVVPLEGMTVVAMETLAAAQIVYKREVALRYQQQFPGVVIDTGAVLLVSQGHALQKRYAFACQLFAGGAQGIVFDWLQQWR
ncbi:hypothetical protein COO60DRAFT_1637907 [Scenedesmus sp. NREL 46B-D3]|nr:hypothetical protein COO60DRAFT_1637907 [Scenedesmus sp. NREL 46B-D3]